MIPIEKFGKDHWSVFAYCECRAVDHGGVLDLRHLRRDGDKYPTKLKGTEHVHEHNDLDCIEDLETAGLLAPQVGFTVKLTAAGWKMVSRLRQHKAAGGSFSDFEPKK